MVFWDFDHDVHFFRTSAPNTCQRITIDTLYAFFTKIDGGGCQKFRVEFGQNQFFCSTGQTGDIFVDDNIVSFVLELKALQKRSQWFFSWVAKIWSFWSKNWSKFGFFPIFQHDAPVSRTPPSNTTQRVLMYALCARFMKIDRRVCQKYRF